MSYDKRRKEVLIEFGLFENAKSTYEIIAKAIDDPRCDNRISMNLPHHSSSSLQQTIASEIDYLTSLAGGTRPVYLPQHSEGEETVILYLESQQQARPYLKERPDHNNREISYEYV